MKSFFRSYILRQRRVRLYSLHHSFTPIIPFSSLSIINKFLLQNISRTIHSIHKSSLRTKIQFSSMMCKFTIYTFFAKFPFWTHPSLIRTGQIRFRSSILFSSFYFFCFISQFFYVLVLSNQSLFYFHMKNLDLIVQKVL